MQPPWHRRLLRWAAALPLLGLLIQTGIIPRNQRAEPDAAVVLEGDPQRIRYAARFAKAHPALPIYISSEPVFYNVYLDTLAEEPVPLERFVLRTCATDSLTSVTCIVDKLKAQGYRHLDVITSAHHMTRALTIGRIALGRHGIAVTPLPVATSRGPTESLARTLRDARRAVVWSVTRIAGPEKNHLARRLALFLSSPSAYRPWHWVLASCRDDGSQRSPPHLSFRLGCRNPVPRMATYPVLAELRPEPPNPVLHDPNRD